MKAELELQVRLCEWLQDNHPTVMFHSDISAGMSLSIGQAVMNKRLQFDKAMPDIYIFEQRMGYGGLFLELKALNSQQIKKDGTMGNEAHIVEQRKIHAKFMQRGYLTDFAIGLEDAKNRVEAYLHNELWRS